MGSCRLPDLSISSLRLFPHLDSGDSKWPCLVVAQVTERTPRRLGLCGPRPRRAWRAGRAPRRPAAEVPGSEAECVLTGS